jgi:hypothetical protein
MRNMRYLRSGDDDFGVNELLIKGRVLTLLIRGGHKSVALILEPLAETKLIFRGAKKLRNLISAEESEGLVQFPISF